MNIILIGHDNGQHNGRPRFSHTHAPSSLFRISISTRYLTDPKGEEFCLFFVHTMLELEKQDCNCEKCHINCNYVVAC